MVSFKHSNQNDSVIMSHHVTPLYSEFQQLHISRKVKCWAESARYWVIWPTACHLPPDCLFTCILHTPTSLPYSFNPKCVLLPQDLCTTWSLCLGSSFSDVLLLPWRSLSWDQH
jgi:hypothetical protein